MVVLIVISLVEFTILLPCLTWKDSPFEKIVKGPVFVKFTKLTSWGERP